MFNLSKVAKYGFARNLTQAKSPTYLCMRLIRCIVSDDDFSLLTSYFRLALWRYVRLSSFVMQRLAQGEKSPGSVGEN